MFFHTFALKKLVMINNLSIVNELLGHNNQKTKEIYTQYSKQLLMQIFKDN